MRIVVTDLTRFNNDELVCLAGLTEDGGQCIRPLFKNNSHYLSYEICKKNTVLPGMILNGNFVLSDTAAAPHTEDHYIDGKFEKCGAVSSSDFKRILYASSHETVSEAFGRSLVSGVKVISDKLAPSKSIVTIKLDPMNFEITADKYNDEKIKAHFTDGKNNKYSFLPITDLGFFDRVGRKKTRNTDVKTATKFIQEQTELYIRLGLSREYQSPDGRNGFWMQVNGIYTFPGYSNLIRTYA